MTSLMSPVPGRPLSVALIFSFGCSWSWRFSLRVSGPARIVTEALAVFSFALVWAASVIACRAVIGWVPWPDWPDWPDWPFEPPLEVDPQPDAATATAAPQAIARLAGRRPDRAGREIVR